MNSKAVELAFPSDAERCFFTLRSSFFTLRFPMASTCKPAWLS
jgi:hypothetical protein